MSPVSLRRPTTPPPPPPSPPNPPPPLRPIFLIVSSHWFKPSVLSLSPSLTLPLCLLLLFFHPHSGCLLLFHSLKINWAHTHRHTRTHAHTPGACMPHRHIHEERLAVKGKKERPRNEERKEGGL